MTTPIATTMSGGEAVAVALEGLGVSHVFGIVSVHNVPILDAIARSGVIELVECRHEQGAVHAADGYARATGRLGVAVTSTGPGAANAMGGLFEAYFASSPVLMITGQVESDSYGRGKGVLHEAESQLSMLRTVTRRSEHVRRHGEIVDVIHHVVADILSGRPRPGAIEIPIDLQYAHGETVVRPPLPVERRAPDEASIGRAVTLVREARRPLIVAGGGAVGGDAGEALVALAERLDAPVLTTIEGRGAIAEDHPLAIGPNTDLSSMDSLWADADVVLAVGTRFQQNNNVHKALTIPGRLVHLDADVETIGRIHPVDVALVGDARLGLEAIIDGLDGLSGRGDATPDPAWADGARALRAQAQAETRDSIGPDLESIMDSIRSTLPREAIVAKDATVSAYLWGNRMLPVLAPRTTLRPVSMAIGPGVPLAIGAAVATGRTTVVIQGDGGLMLSLGELAVAVQKELPLVVCVFNDRGYGILRFLQDMTMGGRRTGVELATPDFAALARAVGMQAANVTSAAEFAASFSAAVESRRPWLLDIDLTALAPMQIRPQRPSTRPPQAR